jgi:(1->4)-alpha-D-glucan 1-alpha-D-glucosylmutase
LKSVEEMKIPVATYRVQLNKDFKLTDLESIIDYLYTLGVDTIYASPVTTAVAGSNHGYDVVDPHRLNPEIGTLDDWERVIRKMQEKNMKWIQDIVPNHMAFDVTNSRLMDVLERGPASEFYHYFDIDWNHPDPLLKGKVMVPVVDGDPEKAIEDKKIKLVWDNDRGLVVECNGAHYPLSVSAYDYLGKNTAFSFLQLPERLESGGISFPEWKAWKSSERERLVEFEKELNAAVVIINNDISRLSALLHQQYYVFCNYRDADRKINYRRFFTINSLICLSMEREEVFSEYHSFIYELYRKGWIQGLRIDHIDGLNDPGAYVGRLRNLFGDDCYIVAEKILGNNETMPAHWPLQGTSGYEFLSYINQVMVNRSGAARLFSYYPALINSRKSYNDIVFESKKLILLNSMHGELDNLVRMILDNDLVSVGTNPVYLKTALVLVLVSFPVYRVYPESFPLDKQSMQEIEKCFNKAYAIARKTRTFNVVREANGSGGEEDDLENAILSHLDLLRSLFMEPGNKQHLLFLKRFMQFTGPLAAKGVEDTTFYVYNPLISLNEVGDSPSTAGMLVNDFHIKMRARLRQTPLSINATSTHDTKRGEDARIRITLLTECTDEWMQLVEQFNELYKNYASNTNLSHPPAINDAYFLLQSLIGSFMPDAGYASPFRERLHDFIQKALRESKQNTSHASPAEEYEKTFHDFADHIFSEQNNFLQNLNGFIKKISAAGNSYSLSQVIIKSTAPGIPDFFQGSECGDFSFVDPDNRRAVDYEQRKDLLKKAMNASYADIGQESFSLQKIYHIHKVLSCRSQNADLFLHGDYVPLHSNSGLLLAYARALQGKWIVVIVPLAGGSLTNKGNQWIKDTHLALPGNAPGKWRNVFDDREINNESRGIPLRGLLHFTAPVLLESMD